MDNSNQSSPMNNSLCTASGAESGWTTYLEDCVGSHKWEASGCSSNFGGSGGGGSSMISDATSCVAWKKLSLKSRKANRVLDDDDSLEDTASSPVNSPKVGGLSHLDVNPREKVVDIRCIISQDKDVVCQDTIELRRDEMDGLCFNERTNNCTELKKRGLCLVPLSMLGDYLG